MSYIEVQFAHQDTEASWSYDGEYVLFLRDSGEGKSRLLQIYRLEVKTEDIKPITSVVKKFITEIHVSPYTHHLAYMINSGNEKHKIIIKNYVDGTRKRIPSKEKTLFGGWTESGIHYFELKEKDGDKWKRCFFDIGLQQITDTDGDVGYFPDMLGQIRGTPIVINQFAKFDNKIRRKDESLAFSTEHKRQGRLREGCSNGDSIFCIRECSQSSVGEIVEFQLEDGQLTKTEEPILSSEEISQQIKIIGEHPRGEIHGFLITNDCIIINLNQDGHSELHRYYTTEKRWERIDLSEIETDIGNCWIEGIDYNESSGLLLTVSSFWRPQHLWRIYSETNDLERLTEPFDRLEIGRMTSKEFLAKDGMDMQYFEIEPSEVSDSTETIVFFHGGPTVQTTCKWDRVIASFLAEKYRIIAPNPRGGIGRGASYCGLDDGEKRLTLIQTEVGPFVKNIDSEYGKPCIYGGSYGGWLVLTLVTSSVWGEYVKAAVSRSGIACMVTFFDGDGKDIPPTAKWRKAHREREYLGNTQGDEMKRLKEKLSPIKAKATTLRNTLIVYGKNDPRVPISAAFAEKFSTKKLPFPDEGHKIKFLHNRIRLIKESLELFQRQLD